MVEWKSVQINAQNIKVDTGRAILIQCPHNSNYDGYSFWHPSKLIRDGKNSYAVKLSYNDEFNFKLVKYGNGKYNSREIIDECVINVEEFEEMFGVMNDNISAKKQDRESFLIVKEPKKIDKEVEVLECLKNKK